MFAEKDPISGVIFIIEFPAPVFYIFKVGRKDKIKYLALNRFVVEAESVCTVRRRAVETLEGGRGEILTVSPPQLEERLPHGWSHPPHGSEISMRNCQQHQILYVPHTIVKL